MKTFIMSLSILSLLGLASFAEASDVNCSVLVNNTKRVDLIQQVGTNTYAVPGGGKIEGLSLQATVRPNGWSVLMAVLPNRTALYSSGTLTAHNDLGEEKVSLITSIYSGSGTSLKIKKIELICSK